MPSQNRKVAFDASAMQTDKLAFGVQMVDMNRTNRKVREEQWSDLEVGEAGLLNNDSLKRYPEPRISTSAYHMPAIKIHFIPFANSHHKRQAAN